MFAEDRQRIRGRDPGTRKYPKYLNAKYTDLSRTESFQRVYSRQKIAIMEFGLRFAGKYAGARYAAEMPFARCKVINKVAYFPTSGQSKHPRQSYPPRARARVPPFRPGALSPRRHLPFASDRRYAAADETRGVGQRPSKLANDCLPRTLRRTLLGVWAPPECLVRRT